MQLKKLIILLIAGLAISCTGSKCDINKANNKMLALNKVQGRIIAKGGESGMKLASSMMQGIGLVTELIAQQKYNEACEKADAIAKEYGMDLENEQKDMITYEQLVKDGGKGSGTCSIADAAKMQMEVHGLLQAEVTAGRRDSDVFRQFNDDTVGFAEMLSTDPSKACDLLKKLKEKYKL